MPSSTVKQQQQRLVCPQLPLAVYREVAAHLQQVAGVRTSVIMRAIEHDPVEKFDYYQSQVAALEVVCEENITELEEQRITEILNYYAQRYAPWQDCPNSI